jgi:hypothetical protein
MKMPLSILATILFLTSCMQDAYEKGEGQYSHMQAEMVMAHADNDKYVDYVITDEGERLVVSTPFTSSWMTTADSTYRGILYFNKGDKVAEPIGFNKVTVLRPKQWKDVKTDPTKLETCWVSTNKEFLNLGVRLMVGSTTDTEAKHLVGAHMIDKKTNIDGTKTMRLQFYHDQNGVPEYYSLRTYFSIPLTELAVDSVRIYINTYDGITDKVFCCK